MEWPYRISNYFQPGARVSVVTTSGYMFSGTYETVGAETLVLMDTVVRGPEGGEATRGVRVRILRAHITAVWG